MAIKAWVPAAGPFGELQRAMNRVFDTVFGKHFAGPGRLRVGYVYPPMNVRETDDHFVIERPSVSLSRSGSRLCGFSRIAPRCTTGYSRGSLLPLIKERAMRHAILAQGQHDNLSHLAHHMSDLVQKVLHTGFSTGGKQADWIPAVDICEMPDHFEIIVELAGVRREDIEVFTEGHHLTVAGCREDPTPRGKVCMHQMEIEEGQFRRRILLPSNVDPEAISARHRDGLLRVQIPKLPPTP